MHDQIGQDPQIELMDIWEEATLSHNNNLLKEKVVSLLHYPQQCCALLEIFLEHT